VLDSAAQLDAFWDAPIGLALFDLDLRFVRVNVALATIDGVPADQHIGRTVFEVLPDQTPDIFEQLRRARDGGRQVELEVAGRRVLVSGGPRWWRVSFFPVRRDGAVVGVGATIVEITQERRAQEALRESNALLRAISDSSKDVLFAKDLEGRIRFANPATLALIGKPLDEVLGRTDAELLEDTRAAQRVMENDRRIMARGVAEDLEERVPLPDGAESIWLSRKVPYRDGNRVVGLLGISTDITERKRSDDARRESEERYRSLFTHMTEGFAMGEVLCDDFGRAVDIRLLELNDAFERETGLRREQILGRRIREVLPQLEQSWIDTYASVALNGNPVRFESYNRDLDRYFSLYCYSPGPRRFAVVFSDITARKRAEEESARDHELLTRLFERLPVMIATYHPSIGTFRFNREFTSVLGWLDQDASEGDFLSRVYPDPEVRAQVLEHMSSPEAGWHEFVVTAKDGSPIPSTWANLRLSDDTQVGIGLDLRERKRAEQALRDQERLLRSTMDHFPTVIAFKDREGRFLDVNGAMEKEFGLPKAQIIGRTMRDFVSKDAAEAMERHDREVMEARAARQYEEITPLPSGTAYHVNATFPLIDSEGRVYGTGHIAHDISAIRRADEALRAANERLEDADRRKDEFLAMLSHELRNPLGPIRNSVHILEKAPPGGVQSIRARQIIDRQVQHLTRLIDDLLDVTRITRGKFNLQRSRVDLNALARASVDDQRDSFAMSGVTLNFASAEQPVLVNGDPTRLSQMIGNLLNNAVKFTPRGGKTTLSIESKDGRAVVRVRDDGAGMSATTVEKVFEPFMQAAQTIDRSRGGLGLGLPLVKGLSEMHGGEAAARSEGEGKGSEFTFWIPLAPTESTLETGERRGARKARALRILVVEDNTDAAESLREIFEMEGHEVAVALTGPDGVEAARRHRPDIIFSDIGLPGLDGHGLARALRCDSDPAVRSTALVALSGYALQEDIRKSLDAGFNRHIAKPPSIEDLEAVIVDLTTSG
jgi:PAS domain S-box-containing protein